MAVVIGPGLLHGGRLLDMDMNDDDWRDKRRVSHRNCIRFTKRVWRRLIAKRRRLAAVGIIVGLFFVLGFLLSERPQLSLPQTASDETLHSSSNTSTQDTHIPNSLRFDPTWDSWAIALKTGQDVALTRTPIQLLTFLSSVRNKIVIGEAPGVTIGDQEMIDVFTGLYEKYPLNETEKYKKSPLDFSVEPQFDRRSLTEPMSGVDFAKKSESSLPDESSLGWRADAHKNLPGFRELYTRFPKAEWYIMIDDDTYLFKENLRLLLQKYDPSVPHYLGSQTIFVGCDNVIEWYEGPLFAHGGSGIVISQAAMKILFKRMDTCILKYRHCWAGDIRTGLCLRDGGILLEDPKGFNKEPPNEHFTFGDDPCFKPLTFHHLLVKQMQSLAQLERNKEAQGLKPVITMADVFNDTRRGLPDVSANMDRPNYDFEAYIDPSPKNCHAMCEENPKCRSYVHDGENCWLKSAVPGNTVATGHVSGIIPSHYTCTKLL